MKQIVLTIGALLSIAATVASAQDLPGAALFRERCTECHGTDAKGVAGHDLTTLWASGATDERVFQTIRQGVPNTIMPSSAAPDDEVRALVTYLRSLNGVARPDAAGGNAANGERLFWSTCGSCHALNGRGGPLGPDVPRMAQGRSRESLTRAIREPKASVAEGYQPVTLVTRDGRRVRATRKSEDAFSIQVMDADGKLRGFLKSDLRDIVRDTNGLMPAFGPDRLSDQDLADVLAFVSAQRAAGRARP